MQNPTPNRRELLTGGIGALAGVATIGAIRAATTDAPAPVVAAPLTTLRGVNWRMVVPVGSPLSTARLPAGDLVDASGTNVGRLETSDLATSGAGTHLHRLHLTDGTLTAVGPTTLTSAEFTVVGGTGRYLHATGTYLIDQSPRGHNWGDSTASLTFTLQTPEVLR